jgi:GTP cyclohydrolase II
MIKFISETILPTSFGEFRVRAYNEILTGTEPLALIVGDVTNQINVPVRVHDQCLTSEVFGSLKCDCKDQLEIAMKRIQRLGKGVIIYLHQEGRGIGLSNKIAAYAKQEEGYDTVDANRELKLPDDARNYSAAAGILDDLGPKSIRLMTNNPKKINDLTNYGVIISGRIPIVVRGNKYCQSYLDTKEKRMGHMY